MTQIGKIKAVTKQGVTVSVIRKGACGDNCSMCGSCNAQTVDVVANCELDVRVGDAVELSSSDTAVIGGMFCLFILPILLPLSAYLLLSTMLGSVMGWVGAGVALVVCLLLIRALSKSTAYLEKSRPSIIRIVRQ